MNHQIVAIRKPGGPNNVHTAIEYYGWIPEGQTKAVAVDRQTAVSMLRHHANAAYVLHPVTGQRAYCYIRNLGNTEFLQTYTDNQWSDNLLSLPTF